MGGFVAGVPSSLAPRTPFFSHVLAPLPRLRLLRRLTQTGQMRQLLWPACSTCPLQNWSVSGVISHSATHWWPSGEVWSCRSDTVRWDEGLKAFGWQTVNTPQKCTLTMAAQHTRSLWEWRSMKGRLQLSVSNVIANFWRGCFPRTHEMPLRDCFRCKVFINGSVETVGNVQSWNSSQVDRDRLRFEALGQVSWACTVRQVRLVSWYPVQNVKNWYCKAL